MLKRNWSIGHIPVLLKHWSPLFDAIKERTDVFPVWVRAPGLPFFLWTESVFKAIGNRLGTYLEADMSFLKTKNRAMARILVSLNPSGGLPQTINLEYKEYLFEQLLDYEHLPFRCHICHEYGHLAKECPLSRRRRRSRRIPVLRDFFFNGAPQPQDRAGHEDRGAEEMETEGTVKEPAMEEDPLNEQNQISKEPAVEEDPLIEQNQITTSPSSAPMEEATKEAVEDLHPISDQENDLRSGSPPISLQDPEHVLNNMHIPPSVISHYLSGQKNIAVNPNNKHDIDTISDALPSLDLNSEEHWPPLVSPPSHNPCPYNLRSMGGKSVSSAVVGGLGKTLSCSTAKIKRGRKSDLLKAKLKAKLDVADGKQQSIPGVLRAVQTPEQVIK